ncbi:hypothetical protein BDQ17DRAFT_1385878 [Cyathus striatus]|nr:hypothetical protein BDQ17DRAFT_1385878 [Cyathus striatus]
MVRAVQILFSLLSPYLPLHTTDKMPSVQEIKSIAIVGAGSAGLAMLKTILDLPDNTKDKLRFVLYEEREDVGGIWLPNAHEVVPPEIPETPLYPLLQTNTPRVLAYHRRYATKYNLLPHILFRHRILDARWTGESENGKWNVTILDAEGLRRSEFFDHLVVATGNNHIPRIPTWNGQDDWLSYTPPGRHHRELLHSVYYRGPKRFENLTVLIVGGGSSGRDIANQIVSVTNKTYISLRHESEVVDEVKQLPQIAYFTSGGVVFDDGTRLDPDVVVLATGYQMRKPFLEEGHAITADPLKKNRTNDELVTNLRYIFPLYRHILSLCPSYPPNALAFIGLPSAIANCPSDLAQSLFTVHAIIQPEILPSRPQLLQELEKQEAIVRQRGFDPYVRGHELLNGTSSDYQDDLIEFLKAKNVIPNNGKKYVEGWRRDIFGYNYLKRGWKRIEQLGQENEWLRGVETEEQWARLMARVNEWEKEWEEDNGVRYVRDFDLAG